MGYNYLVCFCCGMTGRGFLCRVGLLPRVSRPREYVTDPRPAHKPRQAPAGRPVVRVLRSRLPVAEDSDDSGDESYMHDSDSPTSSSTLSVSPRPMQRPGRKLTCML